MDLKDAREVIRGIVFQDAAPAAVAAPSGPTVPLLPEEEALTPRSIDSSFGADRRAGPLPSTSLRPDTSSAAGGIAAASGPRVALMLIATGERLYQSAGLYDTRELSRAHVFRRVFQAASVPIRIGTTGGRDCQLAVFQQLGSAQVGFACQADAGLLYGHVGVSREAQKAIVEDTRILETQHVLTPYLDPSSPPPRSLVLTEFHVLMLFESQIVAVNRFNDRIVETLPLPSGAGRPVCLLRDALSRTVFLVTSTGLFEVMIRKEARDMWHVFLQRSEFQAALRYCETAAQRDTVHLQEAEVAMGAEQWAQAAVCLSRLTQGRPTFEECCLKFLEGGHEGALQVYLLHMLRRLPAEAHAPRSILITWVSDLMLRQYVQWEREGGVDRGGSGGGEGSEPLVKLRTFLAHEGRHLPEPTAKVIVSLLRSYGRWDELEALESARGSHRAVLQLMVQRRQFSRALRYLRRPTVPKELHYEFAPMLMKNAPREAVEVFVGLSEQLEARRLLPALVTAMESAEGTEAVLAFLDHIFRRLHVTDAALHNLAVLLHATRRRGARTGPTSPGSLPDSVQPDDDDDAALLSYLAAAKEPGGRPLYDPHLAWRICWERGRRRACVQLHCELGTVEEAVKLALSFAPPLAREIARSRSADDPALGRVLWRHIARHAADGAARKEDKLPAALAILRESEDCLRIEDILDLVPDFERIDEVRDVLLSALEEYGRQVGALRAEMELRSEQAEELRARLEERAGTASGAAACPRRSRHDPCDLCGGALSARPKFAALRHVLLDIYAAPSATTSVGAGGPPSALSAASLPGGGGWGADASRGLSRTSKSSVGSASSRPTDPGSKPPAGAPAAVSYADQKKLVERSFREKGHAKVLEGLGPFAFPCGHVFHGPCLGLETLRIVGPGHLRSKALSWLTSLGTERAAAQDPASPPAGDALESGSDLDTVAARAPAARAGSLGAQGVVTPGKRPSVWNSGAGGGGGGGARGGTMTSAALERLRVGLVDLMCTDCPACGEMAVRQIEGLPSVVNAAAVGTKGSTAPGAVGFGGNQPLLGSGLLMPSAVIGAWS